MQKKISAWCGEENFDSEEYRGNISYALLELIYGISVDLASNPEYYKTDENTLWIYFPDSCFTADEILHNYGIYMALISKKIPLSVYGSTEGFESSELTAKISNDKIIYQKLNVSGKDFEIISNICIRLIFSSSVICNEYQVMIENLNFHNDYITCERTPFIEKTFEDISQYNNDTYYRYILLDDNPAQYLLSLSVEQIKKLWLLYLEDGISPMEFDDAYNFIAGKEISEFSWELALRIALEEMGITVEYNEGYRIFTRKGRRITPSYETKCSAERLFIKLIFPG